MSDPDFEPARLDRSEATAERFYRALSRIRRVEEEVARVYPTDVIKSPVHLSIGQEAASVAVCAALRPDDVVFGTYRGHALYMAKGGDLDAMVAELYGKVTGCARGNGGSMHLIDLRVGMMGASAVVATTIPQAVGYAMAVQTRGLEKVVVCFLGDGATEEGAFHESLNFAVLWKLPIVFVCENNLYAIHAPLHTRQSTPIVERARAYGMPAVRVEDGDVFTTHAYARAAVDRVRSGAGPVFIECLAYRWREHVGPGEDFHTGFRTRQDAAPWLDRDPVAVTRALLPPGRVEQVDEHVRREIAAAFEFAETSPFPPDSALWDHVTEGGA